MYNYYAGIGNPSSCTATPGQASTGNNGNVMGYWYQDNANAGNSHTATYTYDTVNRLTSGVATGNAAYNLTFGYDRWGNMACQTNGQTNGPCPNWTFNTGTNQINTSGFSYDAAGNLTNDGVHTYQWDGEGRMKSIDNGSTTTFVYNGLGQVARRNGSAWGPYVDEVWDAAGHQMGSFLNGWANQMIYAGDSALAYYFGPANFIHRNALGSNSMITNYSGGVYSDALFYPWGQIWATQDAGMSSYAGFMRYEGDLGIYTPVNRSYNPRLGRWPSPDPLAGDVSNPQSLNRYAYVGNNPTTFTDPLGLQCEDGRQHCPPVEAPPYESNPFIDAGWTSLALVDMMFTPTAIVVGYPVDPEIGVVVNGPEFGNFVVFPVYGNWDSVMSLFMSGALIWSPWYGVKASLEGRGGRGETKLNPKTSYGLNPITDQFVALPDTKLRGQCVEVENPSAGAQATVPVGDVGPQAEHDPYWSPGGSGGGGFRDPRTSGGFNEWGHPLSKWETGVGIDISFTLQQRLGLKGNTQVSWRFSPCQQ